MVFMRVLVVSSTLVMMLMTMAMTMTMILLSAKYHSPMLRFEWNSGNWRGSMARRSASSQRVAMLTPSWARKRHGLDYRTLNQPLNHRKLLATTPTSTGHAGTGKVSVTLNSHSSSGPPSPPSTTTKNPSKDNAFIEDYNPPQTHPPKNN